MRHHQKNKRVLKDLRPTRSDSSLLDGSLLIDTKHSTSLAILNRDLAVAVRDITCIKTDFSKADLLQELKFKETCSTSKIRWYILLLFSFYATQQYFIWNTFGPISSTVKKAFNWENGDIGLLANWDTIIYVFSSMQLCWLIQNKGFRFCFLVSLALVLIGGGFRSLTSDPQYVTWTMNAGQIMNGLGGMMAQSAGPIISNTWFPPEERTTSTAIASLACPLGIALSFIVGPLAVQDLELGMGHIEQNSTANHSAIILFLNDKEAKTAMRSSISNLMYSELIVTAVTLLLAMFYFPDKPKSPPSHTASLPKLEFKKSFQQLIRIKDFWILLIIASSVTGVYSGWGVVLAVNFQDHNLPLSQTDCGWIGFSSTMFSVLGGVAVGYISDKYAGHIKLILIVLYTIATTVFIWLLLLCNKTIPFSEASIYTCSMIGGFCINGSIPLLYELAIELTYPVTEAVSITFLSLANNIFTFLFLLLLSIPDIGVSWMNWCVILSCGLSIVLLFLFSEDYARTDVDKNYKEDITML